MSIYAVWGPPQSGKTTLAIDLAFALSTEGQSVCLISPEPYSELSARLNIQIVEEKSLCTAYKKKESLRQIVHTADDLLYVLAVPFDYDAFADEIPEEYAKALIDQTAKLFDVVIVDCPSHSGCVLAAWALSAAEYVLLMSGGNTSSVLWAKAFKRAIDSLEGRVFRICAQVTENFDYRTLHTMLNASPDIWLPHIPNATILQLVKRTLYQSSGRVGRQYTKHIEEICDLLQGEEDEDTE